MEAWGCCGLWAKPGKALAKTQRLLPEGGATGHRQAPDTQASGRSPPSADLSRPVQGAVWLFSSAFVLVLFLGNSTRHAPSKLG